MTSSSEAAALRRLPIGAEVQPGGGVHFRVWAPRRRRVAVALDGGDHPLRAEEGGYFSGFVGEATAGDRYWLRVDDERERYPDPASRFQPDGPHGSSEIVDPGRYAWADEAWGGLDLQGQVIYEVHVGTYTREGTWGALERELPEIARAGITVVEIMPIADFPGRFGWGYDGVCAYAPTRLYGRPDDFRRFVDRAHAIGLGVILDVVYNHVGPDGNYLGQFSNDFFSKKYDNEWGDAINFDGDGAAGVREFFIRNAGYWIDEYHLDGLRLDATQSIHDASMRHVLAEIARAVREAARGRRTFVVAENERQNIRLVQPIARGGYGLDGLWNDDFHHSAVVALTGKREAYYTDYLGTPQELVAEVKRGFLYQGQRYSWQKQRRGTPTRGVSRAAFVIYLENHDQVANSARGSRLHQVSAPGAYRAMTALLLLGPSTPLLFQGQEFGATSPFLFFADHNPELARAVRKGRAEFLTQFPSLATEAAQAQLAAPEDPATFERSKLDLDERGRNVQVYALHRDLLALRRADRVFGSPDVEVDGAALAERALVLRLFGGAEGDRLLIVNLGVEARLTVVNESLLAPPADGRWTVVWSSDDVKYGGSGTPTVEREDGWRLPGHAAVALASSP